MKHTIYLAAALLFSVPTQLSAHCQVPCGIYDDNNVIGSMDTDVITIEKAAQQVIELSKEPSANAQQIVRWTTNKESHAQALQEKVLNYFLAQRLALPAADADQEVYEKKLALCHEIIVTAMKCKQTTDAANPAKLKELMVTFREMFGTK